MTRQTRPSDQTGLRPDHLLGCWATIETGRRLTPAGETVKKWGHTVKKLLVLALVAIGGLLIWRKVQADRAELDLWTEATGNEN
ncbi:hypothetical protein Ssi02_71080 [Sinosporangium siamense]|uniref:Uncharacterized protein n=1 Tax=Sinosporangium siamense TaxID=1367973 RepID=A0A919RN71_9ACTN|nr:hypothetical protein Ssi02_71080 [Sinosporangium siamense]